MPVVIPDYANGQLGYIIDSSADNKEFKDNQLFYIILGSFDGTDATVANNLIEIPV
jgi:hypothetical protein